MNTEQARAIVKETFPQAFDKGRFQQLAVNLLNHIDESKAKSWNSTDIKDAFKDHVKGYERLGTYTSPNKEKLDVLIVHLTAESKLVRARTAIRNFVADHLKTGDGKDAALVAFVSPSEQKSWRFSYVKMEYAAVEKEDGKVGVQVKLTPARRSSYIVGEGESCHTAQSRFLDLLQDTENHPTLAQIEDAFSVEAVTKEFFEQYKELFLDLKDELDSLAKKDKIISAEFAAKNVSTADFAKKLMGQIVFLYFLQKKGWLGVPKGKDWGDGPHNFLRQLFAGKFGGYKNFFNDILEPLFYDTLATDRGHDAWCKIFNCRIPFLNGGLFEPVAGYDWQKTNILIPNSLFSNTKTTSAGDEGTGILDVFDRYNFTVNEAEPLEKEVAIDPEMLGKVFENLLEVKERKSKGSFYTPREIVHYMCQESLINYLDTGVNSGTETIGTERRKQGLFGDEKAEQTLLTATVRKELIPRADLETFIHSGDQASYYEAARVDGTSYQRKLPKTIETHAKLLDDLLADIAVCDPAIGSGAFPVGMMQEIVRARSALTPYFNDHHDRTAYLFKRHAIQNCIYGVDIDPGAVEIAKLRLWLSLVVDEDDVKQIKPLPNLDYKIVVGNSLLGFPFKSKRFEEIESLKLQYFNEPDHDNKGKLKKQIDEKLNECLAASRKSLGYEVVFDFEINFSEVFQRKGGFDVVLGNPPYISHDKLSEKERLKVTFKTYEPFADIYCYFIEKSLAILQPSGVLAFITSNSYVKAVYGLPLRRALSHQNTILQLLNIEDSQIFQSAIVNVAILIAKRDKPDKEAKTRITNNPCNTEFFREYVAKESFEIRTDAFISPFWSLFPQTVLSLKQKIEKSGVSLENLDTKIRLGIATGSNEAFILNESQRATLVKKDKKNEEIIKPILRGRDIERYFYQHAGLYVLLTKNGINLKRDFPDIYDYLDSFGSDFKRRGAQGQNWFNLRACAFFDDFKKEKIVWIELTDKGRFALCSDEIYLINSAYFMLPPDRFSSKYLLGILNSKLMGFYLGLIAETSGMGTTRWINNYVKEFPIVIARTEQQKPVEKLVERILVAKQRDAEADVSQLEQELDELVYALYGLTQDEIKIVKGAAK
jgi:type I restriction-modification system DNA methylase subunit